MSNLTDFLDQAICVLNHPGEKTITGATNNFKAEDGIDFVGGKSIAQIGDNSNKDLTPMEIKLKNREYIRNYMREYKKVYVQPEHNKSHNPKRRRKHGTALITSAKRRKQLEKMGLTVDKNCYIVKKKEQKDETKSKVRK